jgi:hypothetical protein
VRNSSLVEWLCAEDVPGLKHDTEAGIVSKDTVVEEQRIRARSMTGRTCGLYRRENAGMSSESHVRIMAVESLRFPGEGSSSQGKSGPKPRTEVVGDGQQVDIPVLPSV